MSFIETRLLDCVAYGTEGGPTWATRRVPLRSGIVRRNPRRSQPIYVFSLIYQNLRPEHYDDVIAAFNACRGGVDSFRLKDWSDFRGVNELLPVLGTGSPQTVQLVKAYAFGTNAVARRIRKPVTSTASLTANGSPISSVVNYTNGMATYTAPLNAVVRASFEFDVPVMFSDDALPFQAVNRGEYGLVMTANVGIEEDIDA